MIADMISPSSTVVGVDISQKRISLCKNIIQKYHIHETASASKLSQNEDHLSREKTSTATVSKDKLQLDASQTTIEQPPTQPTIRLYCADGTTFGANQTFPTQENGLVFDSTSASEEHKHRGKRKRMNKSARAREKRRLLELQREDLTSIDSLNAEQSTLPAEQPNEDSEEHSTNNDRRSNTIQPFDRVLVDAECSTDGAVRHNQKRQQGPTWNATNMNELVDLQKRLLDSGFRLCKSGGIVVYSTCSLSAKQNEQVVQWLLEKHKNAFIIPVSFSKSRNLSSKTSQRATDSLSFIQEGSIAGTVRFNPSVEVASCGECLFSGGGFFLAKIGKR